MDIIDQLFPQAQDTDDVLSQFFSGQEPWQILSAVHNSTAKEMEYWYATKNPAPPQKIVVEVKKK